MTIEPACWSWQIPTLKTLDVLAAEIAAQDHLDPNERRSPAVVRMAARHPGFFEGERFHEFHAGRCAICATTRQQLVDDHDHATGQVRGYLCRSCNVLEGRSEHLSFELYRRRHPAAILGHHEMYTGIGWRLGWSLMEHRAGAYENGPRPPTPWPAFSREDLLAEHLGE